MTHNIIESLSIVITAIVLVLIVAAISTSIVYFVNKVDAESDCLETGYSDYRFSYKFDTYCIQDVNKRVIHYKED